RTGLASLAKGWGEGPHLCRIDPPPRHPRAAQACRDPRFEAARGLDRNELDRARLQALDQFVDSTAGAADSESLSIWPHRNVQTVLRYVDANDTCVHLIPSLRNRASQAAQATVRVRWNGRRRPLLTHGLGVPKGRRSSACHRTANPSRTGNAQVTRGLFPRRESLLMRFAFLARTPHPSRI